MASPALRHEVDEILSRLPETATLHDLMYALETRADILEGIADADAGRVVDNGVVRQRFGLE
jgi:predicted transcriptional regulator